MKPVNWGGWRKRSLALLATAVPLGAASFQYNILSVSNTAPGLRPVVVFSVTDPSNNNQPYHIKAHPAFTQTVSGASRLFIQIGWDTRDYTNAGSGSETLAAGAGAALPIAINALAPAVIDNGNGTFTATAPRPIAYGASGTGVAAMEGHPAGPDASGNYTVRVPVKSVYRYFPITGTSIAARRQVVDINKCKGCHGTLSLHGNNRTDEPQVCVVCHNPNATDIVYRQYGDPPEVPIDFKNMVHAIHAGSMRRTPLVIIGFNHSIHDFSGVRFPAKLSNCLNCHLDKTFELPLGSNVLGTTVVTQSILTPTSKVVDGDPANDFNITPTAAVCSGCHDSSSVRRHMVENGASFAALQQTIGSGAVRERCVNCHGPRKRQDVRRVHLESEADDH